MFKKSFYYIYFLKFLFLLLLLLLFITLFIIFFYVIIIIVVIVIKITPDFCHKYRNDMQFPNFWVKIFFFNFFKNVILQFFPFLLSMPHMTCRNHVRRRREKLHERFVRNYYAT